MKHFAGTLSILSLKCLGRKLFRLLLFPHVGMFAYTLAAERAVLKTQPVLFNQHASTLQISSFRALLS